MEDDHVLSSIPQTHPDLILMDIPDARHGWGFSDKRVKLSDIKIIILTTDDDEFIYSALKYSASGYLLRASTENSMKQWVYQGGAASPGEYR